MTYKSLSETGKDADLTVGNGQIHNRSKSQGHGSDRYSVRGSWFGVFRI